VRATGLLLRSIGHAESLITLPAIECRKAVEAMKSYLDLFPQEKEKIAGESRILLMTLPSIVGVDEPFRLKITMLNVSGMPDEGFRGIVKLNPSQPCLKLPSTLKFSPADRGIKTIAGLRSTKPGVLYVEGEVEGSPGKPPRSNPTKVIENPSERLFWGDIHVHSVLGRCHEDIAKEPEFAYWYARQVTHLDFAAVTDHLRGLNRERWERIKALAEEHNRPGDFVALLGFESSHSKDHGGDINVYYLDADAGYFWLDREDMKGTSPKVGLDVLWDWLDRQGKPYLTIPHHTGRAAKYRNFTLPYYNPTREPVLEVFSMWGSSEARHDDFYLRGGKSDAPAYLQDALKLGYRYGVIGSSDTHHTMPGSPCSILPCPYHHPANSMVNQGLAAVYARELSRQAIFDSLMKRRCYATTSTRPILDFWVESTPMGGTLEVGEAQEPARTIRIEVCTSMLPATLEIICNNELLHSFKIRDVHTLYTFTDDRDVGNLWIEGAPRDPSPFMYYYLRLRYQGITAWSSPVWLCRNPV